MEPILRSVQVLNQDAEEIVYEGKEVAEYVKRHQAVDRENRAAWTDAQRIHTEKEKKADVIQMAKIQTEAQKRKRADEIQMAKVEVDKEPGIKQMELNAQTQASARCY